MKRPPSTTSEGEAAAAVGAQTEKFLKRYLELFREHAFAVVSMYKSVFPSSSSTSNTPSPLASFCQHLTEDLLATTLRTYLPNLTEKGGRESLLTQVMFCAGSLGRLGGEFGVMLAGLEVEEEEWTGVVRRYRVQAGRLEVLARVVGTGRKGMVEGVGSPTVTVGTTG